MHESREKRDDVSTDVDTAQFFAIVPAAGVGQRMQSDLPKQYLTLHGKTVVEHTLQRLLSETRIKRIIVPVSPTDHTWRELAVFNDERVEVIQGGQTRCLSVLNALEHLSACCRDNDWIIVHDVARPCVVMSDLHSLIQQLYNDPVGGILAVPVTDTIKQTNDGVSIKRTVDRSVLWQAQTPQMFRFQLLFEALQQTCGRGVMVTDEASAVELAGEQPKLVLGSRSNIKITHPEDLSLAGYYLQNH